MSSTEVRPGKALVELSCANALVGPDQLVPLVVPEEEDVGDALVEPVLKSRLRLATN
jgi:hypothetical protein